MNFVFKFTIFLNLLGDVLACFGGGFGLASLGGGCAPYGGGLNCLPVYQQAPIALPPTYGILPVYPTPCYNPCSEGNGNSYGGYNPFFGGRRHRKRRRRDLINLVGQHKEPIAPILDVNSHQTSNHKFKVHAIVTKKKVTKIVRDFADVPNNSTNVSK